LDKFNIVKLFIYENKRKIIVVVSLILVMFLTTLIFLKKEKLESESITYQNNLIVPDSLEKEEIEEKEEFVEEITYYFVDIKGYVNNPGVYSLEKGKRVVDAINKAGGLKKDANTTLLNLSMEIRDEMVIVVYSNDEVANYNVVKEQEEVKEEICIQEVINDACICVSDTGDDKGSNEDKVSSDETKDDVINKEENQKVNINKANKDELMTLSKIGESKALAIIEYREKNGNFKSIEDIKNVSGIGDKLFEEIKDYITV